MQRTLKILFIIMLVGCLFQVEQSSADSSKLYVIGVENMPYYPYSDIRDETYIGVNRDILEAFHLHRGKGEIFDLSIEPPRRERFAFGGETVRPPGYRITDKCTACDLCLESCPVGVISEGEVYKIDRGRCLECGRCAEVCPEDAIETSQGI